MSEKVTHDRDDALSAIARAEISKMASELGCEDNPMTVFRTALRLAKEAAGPGAAEIQLVPLPAPNSKEPSDV